MLVVAWWLDRLWQEHRRGLAAALAGAAVLASALALAVENTDPRFVEKQLVRWVAAHPGQPLHTDIETRNRSEYFFRFAGLPTGAVRAEAPPAGGRFFYSRERVDQCAATVRCRDVAAGFRPAGNWRVEQTIVGPRRPVAALAERLGASRVLPPDIARRIDAPVGSVTVYRIEQPSS